MAPRRSGRDRPRRAGGEQVRPPVAGRECSGHGDRRDLRSRDLGRPLGAPLPVRRQKPRQIGDDRDDVVVYRSPRRSRRAVAIVVAVLVVLAAAVVLLAAAV